jgi:RimJ/RimL family protein N-acetyltransferase
MIETNRLLIRAFHEEDASALYEYLSDPAVYHFEPGEPVTREQASRMAAERSRCSIFWAVVLKSAEKLVGHLYFQQVDPKEFRTWELGYIFNPAYQRQGLATEASRALIEYGFACWGIHRVVAHCNPGNTASWRVLEKIGMTREGHMRKNVTFRNDESGAPVWCDSYEYAILEDDLRVA